MTPTPEEIAEEIAWGDHSGDANELQDAIATAIREAEKRGEKRERQVWLDCIEDDTEAQNVINAIRSARALAATPNNTPPEPA